MTLTADEAAALTAFNTPTPPTIYEILDDLGIDTVDYRLAHDAELQFSDFLVAVALEDLYLAGVLREGQEVVNIAQQFWPSLTDDQHTD